MKTKTLQRVMIDKPEVGSQRSVHQSGGNFFWTVAAVSQVKTDLAGNDYYEILLERDVAEEAPTEQPEESVSL